MRDGRQQGWEARLRSGLRARSIPSQRVKKAGYRRQVLKLEGGRAKIYRRSSRRRSYSSECAVAGLGKSVAA